MASRAARLLGCLGREALTQVRAPRYVLLALGMPLTLYLVATQTPFAGAGADRTVSGIGWASYFMVSMAALGAIAAALGAAAGFSRPIDGMRRLRLAGVTMAVVAPSVVLVALAGVLVGGVQLDGVRWLELVLWLWLGAVPFVALGLLMRTVLDRDVAGVVVLGSVIVLAILGGLLQPLDTLPATMVAIAHVLPSYHLAALGWMAIVGRGPAPVDVVVLAGYTAILTGILFWRGDGETTHADGRSGDD